MLFQLSMKTTGLIASMINADALLILSTVDGILDGHPDNPDSKTIAEIDPDDKSIQKVILPSKSSFGRGGMATKFNMSRKVSKLGITTFIANGKRANIILDINKGDFIGTKILPKGNASNIKKWIAFNELDQKGTVYINEGAVKALQSIEHITSLLPIGILKIEGIFKKGDIIKIVDKAGTNLGMGVAQYSVDKAQEFLGQKGKKALIHYDYLLLNDD